MSIFDEFNKMASHIEGNDGVKTFIHNTDEEGRAQTILNDGFRFAVGLGHTSDNIDKPNGGNLYDWNKERKFYGPYTVVIQIDKGVYDAINRDSNCKEMGLNPEHILSKGREFDEEDDEFVYTLNEKFVRGYIDRNNGKFYRNPNFNPSHYNDSLLNEKTNNWNLIEENIGTPVPTF